MIWQKDNYFYDVDEFLKWLENVVVDSEITETHVHHTWDPDHSDNEVIPTYDLHKNIENYHVNTLGWSAIAEHITIGMYGDLVVGRDINAAPASALGYNGTDEAHPFMYEMIGNFDIDNDVLDGRQLETVMKVTKYIGERFSETVVFHNEMSSKTCPGSSISKTWFMEQLDNTTIDFIILPEAPVEANNTSYSDKAYRIQSVLLEIGYSLPLWGADGYFGTETVDALKELQQDYGLTVDGEFNSATRQKMVELYQDTLADREVVGTARMKLDVRNAPSETSSILDVIYEDQIFNVYTAFNGWLEIDEGWIIYPDDTFVEFSILVDNSDTQNVELNGSWDTSSYFPGYEGDNYQYKWAGTGEGTFTWNLDIPQDGNYEVFVKFTAYENRATDAPYTVYYDGGEFTKDVDQSNLDNIGKWVSIGSYPFKAGNTHKIMLTDDADTGFVVADAVKLVRVF